MKVVHLFVRVMLAFIYGVVFSLTIVLLLPIIVPVSVVTYFLRTHDDRKNYWQQQVPFLCSECGNGSMCYAGGDDHGWHFRECSNCGHRVMRKSVCDVH